MASRKKQKKDSVKQQIQGERRKYPKLKQGMNGDALRRVSDWVVTDEIFNKLQVHGNTNWLFRNLVTLSLFWVWSETDKPTKAFEDGRRRVTAIYGTVAVRSYNGLMKALRTWTDTLLPILWCRVQMLLEELNGPDWMIAGWLVLAVDGSRIAMPRTKSNEKHFCAAAKDKKKKKKQRKNQGLKKNYHPQPMGPQAWTTLLWHVGYRIAWSWVIGPSNSSEREHFQRMLEREYPENTLFCGDAGFVGYDFWKSISDKGHHFLIRVGSNIRLLKKLGYAREYDGIVYCWPDHISKKCKSPPLVLRLFHFRAGRSDVYLVTNVLNQKLMSQRQATTIYKKRWGIELQFRALKQTYGRGKLKCHSAENVQVELHWSILGLTIAQLLALKERTPFDEPPEKTSIAAVLRAIREAMTDWWLTPDRDEQLTTKLLKATTDDYDRAAKKKSRSYPRHKDEPSAGKPMIVQATRLHKYRLSRFELMTAA